MLNVAPVQCPLKRFHRCCLKANVSVYRSSPSDTCFVLAMLEWITLQYTSVLLRQHEDEGRKENGTTGINIEAIH